MATNLALDDDLIVKAVKLGSHKSKREAVTAALEAYVKAKRRLGILELFGNVEYDPAYNYKAARRRDKKRIPRH